MKTESMFSKVLIYSAACLHNGRQKNGGVLSMHEVHKNNFIWKDWWIGCNIWLLNQGHLGPQWSLWCYLCLPFQLQEGPNKKFKAFVENKNHHINICILEDREWTITLQDLKNVAGLLIYRDRYEKYIPSDLELFGQEESIDDAKEELFKWPNSLREVFEAYQIIALQLGSFSTNLWINHFLATRGPLQKVGLIWGTHLDYVRTFSSSQVVIGTKSDHRALYKEETLLTAYFVAWIKIFLLSMNIKDTKCLWWLIN